VWRRACEVVRERGPRALVFMVLADLGYRRVLLLERWLDDPIDLVTPRVPVAFSPLEPPQIDEYLRFHDEAPRASIERRLARGDECFLARTEGRIVCASWIARTDFLMGSLSYLYPVAPSEAYLYDSYTAPDLRGQAIAPALGVYVLERLRRAGLVRVTMAVPPENTANRRARAKTGFRECGRIDSLRFGRRVWNRHREKSRAS
jgi:ribosomal protein S18 acetylase RimI-like enzyme